MTTSWKPETGEIFEMRQPVAGPWRWDSARVYSDHPDISGNIVCLAPGEAFESHKNWKANARLIAAAPDLLEALRAAVAIADRKTVEFDKARTAIAKAMGT